MREEEKAEWMRYAKQTQRNHSYIHYFTYNVIFFTLRLSEKVSFLLVYLCHNNYCIVII